jgi:hypothetical protein
MAAIAVLLLAGLLGCLIRLAPGRASGSPNLISRENALPGTRDWDLRDAPLGEIEAYTSQVSYLPGDTVEFHVSSAESYRIVVYRLGWYGGDGGRLIGCSPACFADEQGVVRPTPPAGPYGEVVADWPVTDRVPLPSDAVSGYYLASLQLTSGPDAGTATKLPFVVRPEPSQRSAVLVQVPVNTWEAYNGWGGKSTYPFNSDNGSSAQKVSFDRPYGNGAQGPWQAEIQLARFLEREGTDVSYQTDVDTDRDPDSLLTHRLVMTAGHGEYWTHTMRDAFDHARDVGTNLAFMGSNTGYWQVRYEDNRRTMVAFKSSAEDPIADPALKTDLFRALSPPRPECELLGVMHSRLREHQTGWVDYTVTSAAATDQWFADTGFHPGDTVRAVVGGEWDEIPQPPPAECAKPNEVVLFHFEGAPQNADAVRYTAPSGARVFASGAQLFSWGLDTSGLGYYGYTDPPDPRLQQFMRNALDDLTRPAPPIRYSLRVRRRGVNVSFTAPPDPRIRDVAILRSDGTMVCTTPSGTCFDRRRPSGASGSYAGIAIDEWRFSRPLLTKPIRLARGQVQSGPLDHRRRAR